MAVPSFEELWNANEPTLRAIAQAAFLRIRGIETEDAALVATGLVSSLTNDAATYLDHAMIKVRIFIELYIASEFPPAPPTSF